MIKGTLPLTVEPLNLQITFPTQQCLASANVTFPSRQKWTKQQATLIGPTLMCLPDPCRGASYWTRACSLEWLLNPNALWYGLHRLSVQVWVCDESKSSCGLLKNLTYLSEFMDVSMCPRQEGSRFYGLRCVRWCKGPKQEKQQVKNQNESSCWAGIRTYRTVVGYVVGDFFGRCKAVSYTHLTLPTSP
jgi:hypothetical protein